MAERLRILAVGNRMPGWVTEAVEDYRKRLPRDYAVALREIPVSRRGGERGSEEEGAALLAALAPQEHVVTLEVEGKAWSSTELATAMRGWHDEGRAVAFLIGGPDGLSPAVRARRDQAWSLSRLTLPHALARIVVIEQLYRAWSILHSHPYHR